MNERYRQQLPELSPQDQGLLDALVESDFDVRALEGLGPDGRHRAAAITGLFELLEDYPVEDADDTLVHATLARIDRIEDERAARFAFESAREAPRRRFRMPDFISVAAVILIGASVVWPLSSLLRQRAIDSGCADNLRRMGLAFSQYAVDYRGMMPVAEAGLFSSWSHARHNDDNLQPLIAGNYCRNDDLRCPGHEGMYGDSYSYQWQLPGTPSPWGTGRPTLVLADRNPLIDAALAARDVPALSNSINHGARGQNVLASNCVTIWLIQPVVGGNDNIWLPGPVLRIREGIEVTDPGDAFVAQ